MKHSHGHKFKHTPHPKPSAGAAGVIRAKTGDIHSQIGGARAVRKRMKLRGHR
jgi:hypothetical protein